MDRDVQSSAPTFPFSRSDPFAPPGEYARARAQQPIVEVTLWNGGRAWLVTRYDDFRSVLGDPRFSGGMGRPDFPAVTAARVAIDKQERAFIGMDNPRHGHFRRMFTKEFSRPRMMALRPKIEKVAVDLLDEMVARGSPADLVAAVAVRFPSLVMCDLIGSPYEDHVFIMACAAARHGLNQSAGMAHDKARELVAYFRRLIERKESAPGDDLVSRIVAEQVVPGHLSRDDFAEIGAMILRAGHDTTTNMIGLGTLVLLQHPDQLALLRDDPSVVQSAVEELLRFISPVQYAPRRVALEDVELGGVVIRKGDGVFALTPSANRDDTAFPDPDRLDLRRDASHHVAFSFGIHQCLGQSLARIELEVIFPMLLRRLPHLRLAAPLEEIRFKADMQIYGVYNLPVAW